MNILNNIHIAGIASALVFSLVFLPSASAASMTMPGTWSFQGTVTEVNRDKIELFGTNKNGMEQRVKFSITPMTEVKGGVLLFDVPDEVRWNTTNEIRRGMVVTVWATTSGKALTIVNKAPWGHSDFFGPVDCSRCGK